MFGQHVPNKITGRQEVQRYSQTTPQQNAEQAARDALSGRHSSLPRTYIPPPQEDTYIVDNGVQFWDEIMADTPDGTLPRKCIITSLSYANATKPGSTKSKLYNG